MGGGRGGERGSAVGAAVGWAARGIPTLCNEMGASGRKDPPSNPTTHPPQSTAQTPPCPSLPGTVTARPLFAKGVLFCPSRCQQSSQGMGGGTERGAVPGPPTPPKEPHWGVSTSTIRPCGPLTPSARGGCGCHPNPTCVPIPALGGSAVSPRSARCRGGQHRTRHRDCAQRGQRAVGVGGTAPRAPPWHRGGDEMAWGPWWQTMGAVVARGPQRHTMRAAMAHRGDHNGRGTTMAHRGHYDGTPWGPQRRIIGTVMAGGPW